ncbi:MAG: 4Fe-4S binding protein [Planctomycetota bacterium]
MNPRRGIAVGLVCLGIAMFGVAARDMPVGAKSLATTAACVLTFGSLLVLLTTFDEGRSVALLRLDWFTRALRRLKPGQQAAHTLIARLLRRTLPQSWQSNWTTKRRGLVRRCLRAIGISWLASPIRRLTQAVCLLTFVVLFVYVCWPYDARPDQPDVISKGWVLTQLESETGTFEFASSGTAATFEGTESIYLVDQEGALGSVEFTLVSHDKNSLALIPAGELSDDWFDAILTSTQTWSLSESDPNAWPSHYADNLKRKEWVPAESFLMIDPLVSLSTAIASRSWVWSLSAAGAILIVCVLIPRGFCGYLCPLGTTIDLFDWMIGKRVTRFRAPDDGWWVHLKYYLLAGTFICAAFGVLVSGFFSAIPVITRAALFIVEPVQSGALRGWHLVPPIHLGQLISITLFVLVLSLGFFRPRFWCKYVCPSGAVFSLGNLFRIAERKVESSCIHCNKCVEICPFDAIKPDFTTRTTDCTLCQSCGGVCPTHAIKFVERWNVVELKAEDEPPTNETVLGRRGFLSLATGTATAAGGAVAVSLATKTFGARLDDPGVFLPVRPPGSVPEREFLEMCIRCGECFKVCPNNVLQPEGFEQGLEGLWAPTVNADWAGCESSCNACGQVCPTGAIRELPLAEKRVARMGLAIVNDQTCLPFAGREECDLCVKECNAAGYHAIEYEQVGAKLDGQGIPVPGTGFSAPVVIADKCVGCGLCQTRCVAINVKDRGVLDASAIVVEAGEGKEDRLMEGSYRELRRREAMESDPWQQDGTRYTVPPESVVPQPSGNTDPFGIESPEKDDDPFGLSL